MDLARRPLSESLPGSSDTEGNDSVVDLTGNSEEEEVIDLTSPGDSCTIVGVERDGLARAPPAHDGVDVITVEQVAPPLSITTDDISILIPCLSSSPHSTNNVAPPTPTRADEDDVIIVSSYNPVSRHAHAAPPILNTSPNIASLSPHISRIVTCPICMETQKNFTMAGSCLVATRCGHLFCDSCLKKAISLSHKCPTCSSKLSARQFHRIYL